MSDSPHCTPAGGGVPNGAFGLPRRFHVLSDAADGAFAVWEEDIPEGAGPPLHVHHGARELFAVLSGRILFRCGEEELVADAGATVLIPPGAPHAFRGLGPGPSRALVTLTPGGGERFFIDVEAEGLTPAADMPRIVEIAARTGLEFVGPPI